MKNVIYLLLLTFCLSNCSTFKKVTRKVDKIQLDSASFLKKRTVKIDTSKKTTVQEIDTIVTTTERIIKKEFSINQNLSNTAFIESLNSISDAFVELNVAVDSLKGVISVEIIKKPESISVKNKMTTTENTGITEEIESSEGASLKKDSKLIDKVSTPDYKWIPYLIGTLFILFLIAFFYKKNTN